MPARVASASRGGRARTRRAVAPTGFAQVHKTTSASQSGEAGKRIGRSLPHSRVVEIQRARLLTAAVYVVEERGYARATVAHITHRARISRRTFYELFENREGCMRAILDDALQRIGEELERVGVQALPWRERLRVGLAAILHFLDREPALARVCFAQAQQGEQSGREHLEGMLTRLTELVDEGRSQGPRGRGCAALTSEGLVGAAFTIVHTRLLHGESLSPLHGELMAMIVLPYLGPAAARQEQMRVPDARVFSTAASQEPVGGDPLEGISMRLTYRTARVLADVAGNPGASNREIASRAGILDQGQVSKLLARLERLGLLVNDSSGHAKGEPNAWSLTPAGAALARSIATPADSSGVSA